MRKVKNALYRTGIFSQQLSEIVSVLSDLRLLTEHCAHRYRALRQRADLLTGAKSGRRALTIHVALLHELEGPEAQHSSQRGLDAGVPPTLAWPGLPGLAQRHISRHSGNSGVDCSRPMELRQISGRCGSRRDWCLLLFKKGLFQIWHCCDRLEQSSPLLPAGGTSISIMHVHTLTALSSASSTLRQRQQDMHGGMNLNTTWRFRQLQCAYLLL